MMPFKTILFATDFSPASNVAFGVASALARDYRARIVVLHVIEPVHGLCRFTAYVGPDEDRVSPWRIFAPSMPRREITLEHRLLEGEPPEVIVATAAEPAPDLIVMGTMGRTG